MRAVRLMIGLTVYAVAAFSADPRDFFETSVRPVLAKNCFACHAGAGARMGGLEMKSRESLLKGGASGPAIVPGKPEESLLIQAVNRTHERLKMPPQGKLKPEEIEALAVWVKTGASWPDDPPGMVSKTAGYLITPEQRAFWSFQPIRKPSLPEVQNPTWAKAPIDHFIQAQLKARGLTPAPAADKRTLIRRATFDLIGLPPTPDEVQAFLKDSSPEAFRKVVDRLLASPHYGERRARYWLDVARYADDKLEASERAVPNAFRYRDWVIRAFNEDMPYDEFVKAQIAGDLMDPQNTRQFVAGVGLYSLSPELQEDRVDVTTRGFLGLTVACAQCHDHKYDPIPTKDYYSLLGVFKSTEPCEFPLAPEKVVTEYKKHKQKVDDQQQAIKNFIDTQSAVISEVLAGRTADYLMAASKAPVDDKTDRAALAGAAGLDRETLDRWAGYLKESPKDHPYFDIFERLWHGGAAEAEVRNAAEDLQRFLLSILREKQQTDEQNKIITGGATDELTLAKFTTHSLERNKFVLWKDVFAPPRRGALKAERGLLYYGEKDIERFLPAMWKAHLAGMRAELDSLKKELPPPYPFLHALRDSAKPANIHVYLRGNAENPGEEAPRRFPAILSKGEPVSFRQGSGRMELAEAIADPQNPLTARVMVNRIWQYHFGAGIVRTASNFGFLGDRPSHPELLDYLAARFIESHWSVKAIDREIMLSATYALSTENSPKNFSVDPDNRSLWRANRRRLDVEALRDSLLYISGTLDPAVGGPPLDLTDDKNHRRTVYGNISRKKLDDLLALFDFPNPNMTSEQRVGTNVPLQQLFFLNGDLMLRESAALAHRLEMDAGSGDESRVERAYRLIFGRAPKADERNLALEFLQAGGSLPEYLQTLLSSNDFVFVN